MSTLNQMRESLFEGGVCPDCLKKTSYPPVCCKKAFMTWLAKQDLIISGLKIDTGLIMTLYIQDRYTIDATGNIIQA